jgi:NADPH2 dehydrogenase
MLETIFSPFEMRGTTLRNRIVMAPMSQGASDSSGQVKDWHFVHYGSRAVGGAGLIMLEDSAVAPDGRGSTRSLGLYNDAQAGALRRVIDFCQSQGARVGVQLGHAGFKAFAEEPTEAPVVSATETPYSASTHPPRALSADEVADLVGQFASSASRAIESGTDVIEIHASHGYLLHQFLSPITNTRDDRYGGDLRRNARFLIEVVEAVRSVMSSQHLLMVRLPIDDLAPGGLRPADAFEVGRELISAGCDIIDASAGGVVENATQFDRPVDFLELARTTRQALDVPTVVSGGIASAAAAEQAVAEDACSLVAIGRLLLENPYWVNNVRNQLTAG